jgi:hypothetical protein
VDLRAQPGQTRYEAGLLPQVAVFGLLSSATLAFCVLGIHLPPEQLFPNIGERRRPGTSGWRGRC